MANSTGIADIGVNGAALIKAFEGFHDAIEGGAAAKAYRCPAGVWTIGWGHTGRIHEGQTATRAQCEQFLHEDLQDAVHDVQRYVTTPLTQNQFDALVSFVFNVGAANFAKSTLLKRVNARGAPSDIAAAFGLFRKIKVNGQYQDSPGLARRRENEARLFNAPADSNVIIGDDGSVQVALPAAPKPAPAPAPEAAPPATPAPSAQASPGSVAYPGQPSGPGPDMPQKPTAQPPKPLGQSRTLGGVIVAALGAAGAFFAQLSADAGKMFEALKHALGFNPLWALLALFVLGLLIVVFARLSDQQRRTF